MAHEECSGYFQKEADGRATSGVKGRLERLGGLVYDLPGSPLSFPTSRRKGGGLILFQVAHSALLTC